MPLVSFLMLVLFFSLMILIIQIPIFVARNRGITGTDYNTIVVLSWLGIFLGITWTVALVLSLVGRGGNTVSDLDKLEKLQQLKKSGAITQKEFDAEKKKILG